MMIAVIVLGGNFMLSAAASISAATSVFLLAADGKTFDIHPVLTVRGLVIGIVASFLLVFGEDIWNFFKK